MKKLLVFVVLLALGLGAAHHFGYLDRLLAGGPRSRLIPKDPKLLGYFGPDTRELLVLQLTLVDERFMKEAERQNAQDWKDFQAKTGIHPVNDLDAFAAADGLGVLRGRFDWSRLSAFLQTEGYTLTELAGVPAAVKAQAADLALDGNYLLIGPRAALEPALLRQRSGQGLDTGSPIVKAIDELGWKHTIVGGVASGSRLANEGPREMMKMQSAVGAFDSLSEGFELSAVATTGSKQEGDALRAMLEVLRQTVLLQMAFDSQPETQLLRDSLQKATLEVDPQGRVKGVLRLPYEMANHAANLSRAQLPSALQSLTLANEADEPVLATPPSVTPPAPVQEPAASPAAASAPVRLDWKPPVLGLFLLMLALLTMGAKSRPGYLNVLLHPLFLLPFLVSTLGVFVFRWTGHHGGAYDLLARPMPEWHRFLPFEAAQPAALSALLPMVLAIVSGPVAWLRRVAAGLGVGFSAYLVVQALAGTRLALLPPTWVLPWLAGNALAALLLARLTLPQRAAR